MGTAVVCGPKAQKAVVCGPKAQKLSPAAGDLFDGLQSNLIDHIMMGSQRPKKIPKMQKKCAWAEMYQNDGLPWIYPGPDSVTTNIILKVTKRERGV
jgi:hypothetical protein